MGALRRSKTSAPWAARASWNWRTGGHSRPSHRSASCCQRLCGGCRIGVLHDMKMTSGLTSQAVTPLRRGRRFQLPLDFGFVGQAFSLRPALAGALDALTKLSGFAGQRLTKRNPKKSFCDIWSVLGRANARLTCARRHHGFLRLNRYFRLKPAPLGWSTACIRRQPQQGGTESRPAGKSACATSDLILSY